MPQPELFFDSSALIAGIASPTGGARALLDLGEAGVVTILVSDQVMAETKRVIARKLPGYVLIAEQLIRSAGIRILRDPQPVELEPYRDLITHTADLPILVSAIKAQAGFLVTLNRRHFVDDPEVAHKAKLRIGTPGDALAWVRAQLL